MRQACVNLIPGKMRRQSCDQREFRMAKAALIIAFVFAAFAPAHAETSGRDRRPGDAVGNLFARSA